VRNFLFRLAIRRLYISESSSLGESRGCLSLGELVQPGLALSELVSLGASELALSSKLSGLLSELTTLSTSELALSSKLSGLLSELGGLLLLAKLSGLSTLSGLQALRLGSGSSLSSGEIVRGWMSKQMGL